MDNLIEFLSSNIAISIYVICLVLCGIVIGYYYLKKSSPKRRQKQNTKELENLVLEVEEKNKEIESIKEKPQTTEVLEETPPVIIKTTDTLPKVAVIEELAQDIRVEEKDKVVTEPELPEVLNTIPKKEENPVLENVSKPEEELVYAPIELNETEAKKELEKVTQELINKEEAKIEESIKEENTDDKNIALTNFEKEQEENAIISLDELMQRANDIYEKNEAIQYQDEGNEPISIDDLQRRWQQEQQKINELEQEVKVEEIATVKPEQPNPKPLKQVVMSPITTEVIRNNKEEEYNSKFRSSPIISPVYGIERRESEKLEAANPQIIDNHELALENTANYEKFDEEIRKTNEFIAALKELQKKLD